MTTWSRDASQTSSVAGKEKRAVPKREHAATFELPSLGCANGIQVFVGNYPHGQRSSGRSPRTRRAGDAAPAELEERVRGATSGICNNK